LQKGAKIKTVNLSNPISQASYEEEETPSILKSAINTIKNLFGRKKEEEVRLPETSSALNKSEEVKEKTNDSGFVRNELFPEHWDSMPQAYIQLLMQAKMDYILEFAYKRLTVHPDFESILAMFEPDAVLDLLMRPYGYSNKLGFTLLEKKSDIYKEDENFVGDVLNCKSIDAVNWARDRINENKTFYTSSSIFLEKLILNTNNEISFWINDLIKETAISADLQKATIGRVVASLLSLRAQETSTYNGPESIARLEQLCSNQFEFISWDIVQQLMDSPIQSNVLLASKITKKKFKANRNETIPFSLIEKFLVNELNEVRIDGLQLLEENKSSYINNFPDQLVQLANTRYKDVFDGLLKICYQQKGQIADKLTFELINCLIRKEKFENSHAEIAKYLETNLMDTATNKTEPRLLLNLIHCNYRVGQNMAFEILKKYQRLEQLSMSQIASIGSHELLSLRQWCHNYYNENIKRIKFERKKALALLDSKWEDSKEFAMQYFKNNFNADDWDLDTIVELVDTPTDHIESFGLQILQQNFKESYGEQALMKLSEHPSIKVQWTITNYLDQYAKGNPEKLQELEMYFKSILSRVNKGRLSKNRIFAFLENEIHSSEKSAQFVARIIDDISALSSIEDKEKCINILTKIKQQYPAIDMHLQIENV
ncbi:MAG: hypothetical protein RLZZ546_1912, partial [Bacteroidota bacterium]